MNQSTYQCLDYRREKLADPKHLSPTAQAHVVDCALCQAFSRRIDSFEAQVADALSVPVPEGLAERVILRAQQTSRRTPWRGAANAQWQPSRRLMAAAASVFLAVTLALNFIGNPFAPKDNSAVMVAVTTCYTNLNH